MEEEIDEQKVFVYICDFTSLGPVHKDPVFISDIKSSEFDSGVAIPKPQGTRFRWIHIPVNDTSLAEDCVRSIIGPRQADSLKDTWSHQLRPTSCIPAAIIPNHARFMEPSFQIHKDDEERSKEDPAAKPTFSLFMPYLNWEVFKNISKIAGPLDKSKMTLNTSRHPRRTLDQFFYPGLRDTISRDAGQTVSKWTGKNSTRDGRKAAVDDSYVVMVEQIWVWVYLESETLISCFPSDNFQFSGRPGAKYTDVRSSVVKDSKRDQDLFDLTALLVMHSVTNLFAEKNSKGADVMEIYRWAIGNKAARQTQKLEEFSRNQAVHDMKETQVEDVDELNLILEVADILDELNMLLLVLEKQTAVLKLLRDKMPYVKSQIEEPLERDKEKKHPIVNDGDMEEVPMSNYTNLNGLIMGTSGMDSFKIISISQEAKMFNDKAGILLKEAEKMVGVKNHDLERLHKDASQTHKMLLGLLDLQQKSASLEEARATTNQGRAIMLFTIVTIIFVPLSFFTSYYGQNIADLTGDDRNPTAGEVWTVAAPISVLVIACAFLVVYYIFPRTRARRARGELGVREMIKQVIALEIVYPNALGMVLGTTRLGPRLGPLLGLGKLGPVLGPVLRPVLRPVLGAVRAVVRAVLPTRLRERIKAKTMKIVGNRERVDIEMGGL
ncbi:hypothetical protein BS50DRAFT_536441 [Corynespora cassiicola Philippines]|uniref:Uncharacterized protein n=1 Tax=Corynespora cassiicola Philippines TaxID=1448308 RepID=A0A2T2N3R6_CORCC|nr:hypothetical protein BS50DRAFT_536441 [Corynespora cassiicola Philippines]